MLFGFVSLSICLFTLGSIIMIIVKINNKYVEVRELEKKLADLQEEEKELNSEIVKLQDPDYLARYAREKNFYSKDNEIIIRIPTK